MYYIYEVPGVKIGCSEEPNRRVAKQGYTDYKILEEHNCIYTASDRERELQKEKGYPVDKHPYWKVCQMATLEGQSKGGRKTGRKNVESGHLSRIGKIAGRKAVESGQLASIRKIAKKANRQLTFGQAQEIRQKWPLTTGGKIQRYDQLGAEYNVALSVISNIVKNKTYKEK
jgi:hypothetical protein